MKTVINKHAERAVAGFEKKHLQTIQLMIPLLLNFADNAGRRLVAELLIWFFCVFFFPSICFIECFVFVFTISVGFTLFN